MILASNFSGLLPALWMGWGLAFFGGLIALFIGWKRSRLFVPLVATVACATFLAWVAHDAETSFGQSNAFYWMCSIGSVALPVGWCTLASLLLLRRRKDGSTENERSKK